MNACFPLSLPSVVSNNTRIIPAGLDQTNFKKGGGEGSRKDASMAQNLQNIFL